MLKKLLFGAGLAYLARRFMGARRDYSTDAVGGSRWGRRGW